MQRSIDLMSRNSDVMIVEGVGGAMVPKLALGIPGSTSTAIILAGVFLFPGIFWLWMAVFGGGALIASGFYVRHFWRSGYADVLGYLPTFTMWDDHEFWNDYPERQAQLMRTWKNGKEYGEVAGNLYRVLGDRNDLHALYWLVVGGLSLRAATNVLRPRGGTRWHH